VRQKLIAESLALGGALDQAGDVDEFDDGGDLLLRLDDLVERFEARVRHLDDADVRLDRTERIVLGRCRFRGRECVEQRRLADIGETTIPSRSISS